MRANNGIDIFFSKWDCQEIIIKEEIICIVVEVEPICLYFDAELFIVCSIVVGSIRDDIVFITYSAGNFMERRTESYVRTLALSDLDRIISTIFRFVQLVQVPLSMGMLKRSSARDYGKNQIRMESRTYI